MDGPNSHSRIIKNKVYEPCDMTLRVKTCFFIVEVNLRKLRWAPNEPIVCQSQGKCKTDF